MVVPGPGRLQARWDKNAPGYDVRLHGNGVERTKLITSSAAQFDGLTDGAEYQIEVRAVDEFGQRSEPATGKNRPSDKQPDESRYALVDHFDDQKAPDPARWRLADHAACARMGPGTGEDGRRVVITAACGQETFAVRSRTPLRLNDNAGELGRVMIETDAPQADGELTLDLVPGQADLIGKPSPGTIRVRITPQQVELPGTAPIPVDNNGISMRWELVLHREGLRVWRDGILIGSSNVVPTWSEATPLFGFVGPLNGLASVAIDAIGISNSGTPPFVPPPRITTSTGKGQPTKLAGVLGGQLRMTIGPSYGVPIGPFTVDVGGQTFPVRPAVADQAYASDQRYPAIADIPADALLVSGHELPVTVRGAKRDLPPVVQHIDLELTPDPASSTLHAITPAEPVARPRPMLAAVTLMLLDAAGREIESGPPSPRGRVVLEIAAAGAGELAGLAGVEIWVDNKRIAGTPTTRDGPGIAGRWRLALNTAAFEPGVRNLEVRAVSTDPGTSRQIAASPWHIPY